MQHTGFTTAFDLQRGSRLAAAQGAMEQLQGSFVEGTAETGAAVLAAGSLCSILGEEGEGLATALLPRLMEKLDHDRLFIADGHPRQTAALVVP